MISKMIDGASVDTLSKRFFSMKKKFQLSKAAFENWVAEERLLIEKEEQQLILNAEAIDVNCDEIAEKSVVCAKDETDFNMLIAAADKILSEK